MRRDSSVLSQASHARKGAENVPVRLASLHARIRRCRRCPLWRTRIHAVPGEGSPRAGVMIVGEGPGREEDLSGRPFVGRAGRLLDDLLASVGLRRDDVYVTNALKDRAATAGARVRDRPPLAAELAACGPWLAEQLDLIRPKIVVTLGRVALAAFLPQARIRDVHGRVLRQDGRVLVPLYHPSYALHDPGMRPVVFEDVRALAAALSETGGRAVR